MLKITKATDKVEIPAVKLVIYGQPGTGKTSISFTAEQPLLLDFDGGAYRSGFRKDSVQINDWKDIAQMKPEDLRDYQTVVVDTVGRCLDLLAADIIRTKPKLAQGSGALSMQGWGELKARFAAWTKNLQTMGKDLVLIAHDKEDKRGDDVVMRPDVQGGSYGEIFKIADGVGYLCAGQKGNQLDFSPTEKYVGKNPAGFEQINVPHLAKEPDFLAGLIQQMKDRLGNLSEESAKVAAEVEAYLAKIEVIENLAGLNEMTAEIKGVNGAVQIQTRPAIMAKASDLKAHWDKKSNAFIEGDSNAA